MKLTTIFLEALNLKKGKNQKVNQLFQSAFQMMNRFDKKIFQLIIWTIWLLSNIAPNTICTQFQINTCSRWLQTNKSSFLIIQPNFKFNFWLNLTISRSFFCTVHSLWQSQFCQFQKKHTHTLSKLKHSK